MPLFQAAIELPCQRSRAFDYVRRPANLVQLIAPPNAKNFEYHVPERLEMGSHLQFRMRQFGMKIEIVHEVVELVEHERITLNQLRGPFRHWFHECAFIVHGQDQTKLTERFQFEAPAGFLGLMVTNSMVLDELQKHVARGHELLRHQFGFQRTS